MSDMNNAEDFMDHLEKRRLELVIKAQAVMEDERYDGTYKKHILDNIITAYKTNRGIFNKLYYETEEIAELETIKQVADFEMLTRVH